MERKGYVLQKRGKKWSVLFYYRPPMGTKVVRYCRSLGIGGREPSDRIVREALDGIKRKIDAEILEPEKTPQKPTPLVGLINEHCDLLKARRPHSSHSDEKRRTLLASLGRGDNGPGIAPLPWTTTKDIDATGLERRLAKRREEDIAAASVNKEARDWSSFVNWIVKRKKVLRENPLSEIERFTDLKREEEGVIIVPSVKIGSLLTQCCRPQAFQTGKSGKKFPVPPAPAWLFRSVLISLYVGLRAEELARLRCRDVDLKARTIYIRPGKTMKGRKVPLHSVLAEELRRAGRERREGLVVPGFPYLFRTNVRPIRSYERPFKTACRCAGVSSRITWHCLRHTFASRAIRDGVPLPLVSRWLGHASLQVTLDHYSRFEPDHQADLIEQMEFDRNAVQTVSISRSAG